MKIKETTIYDLFPDYNPNYKPSYGSEPSQEDLDEIALIFRNEKVGIKKEYKNTLF